jgi:hypothetical protein
MLDRESPRARYQCLAQDCLETAQTIQNTEARAALIEMAQVWQRLANARADSTPPFIQPGAGEKPAMQQQQQVQPKTNTEDDEAAN